ncbi:DUF6538 domain-containing protein [Brevundimonas sp. G8]|uniref:DUF6538 domain-containing protein n=1 Tax=Brevundimonas sp. G8 TaxID=1350776 RepID=UPI0012F2F7EF|nr:DUF6538 domain-containing protein [Brevundimonas sp. G8]VXC07639.1 conserved hypothetical protein [Brevundimonas sp. G8]
MTDMPTGLIRRGGAYSLRRRVPMDLIVVYDGRKEIVRALGTNDFAEAKRSHARLWVELDEEFEARRATLAVDPDAHIKRKLAEIRPLLARNANRDEPSAEEIECQIEEAQFSLRMCLEEEGEYERRELPRQRLLALLSVPNHLLTPEEQALKDLISDARFDVEKAKSALAKRPEPVQSPVPARLPPARRTAGIGASFDDLIAGWERDRSPQVRTVAAHKAVAQWFVDRTGVSNVRLATADDVRTFRTRLIEEGQTAANIRTKLSRLRTLFGYACEEGIIDTNPAANIRPPADKRPGKARLPWSADDLNILFSGPIHSAGSRPIRGRGEAAYWLPLLALFSGARLEELAQLRRGDIREEPYEVDEETDGLAWCIDINTGPDGNNHVKNAGAIRLIPLHPTLINLGFLKYAQSNSDPNALLFPDLKPNGEDRHGAKWGEWFSTYRRSIGLNDSRKVFHSLRHTFKDYCRGSKLEERVQRQLMGHAPIDVGDTYGVGFGYADLVSGIRAYRVPRLATIAPPASSLG